MKILIATLYLDNFAGSEVFTVNIARKLKEKGHEVYIFSPVIGDVAKKLKELKIPVTDNLSDLKNIKFDIIHAQHNVNAILVRSMFPKTPMIYMAHGFLPDTEQPPSIDLDIAKFVVISDEIKNHYIKEYSIPEDKIKVLRNSVNVNKFKSTKKVNKNLKNVLIISNHFIQEIKEIVEKACDDLGLEFTHVGLPENPVEKIENYINKSDLVIALGRGALEAMSCERNVIIYDIHGGDGFVDEKNFFEIRKNNFSGRRFGIKYSADLLKRELDKYNPNIGKNLRKIIEKEHSLEGFINDLLNIYSANKNNVPRTTLKRGELYREISFLESFNAHLEKSTKAYREEIKGMTADMKEKIIEEERLENLIHEKDDIIARMSTSTSWKITRPIRMIKNIISKLLFLEKKSIAVIKSDGVIEFMKRATKFVLNRITARLYKQKTYSHNYIDISRWYRNNKKKVTIVIPSYSDFKLLKKCIDSINKTVEEKYVDIVIVDDASPNKDHKDFLKSLDQKNIKVIYNKKNSGFAKTVNVGMRAAKTGDVVVLNSDIEAKKYWLESLQYAAYTSNEIGIVGGKLLYPNKTIQYAGSYRNLDAPEWFDHYYRFKPSSFPPANIPNYVIGITGACMYIKRNVINDIGYLDEKFPMAFEDMDYSLRAWNENYKCLYFPMATLIHHESVTRGTKQGAREKESLRYFWEKWGDWFDKRNVKNKEGITKIIYVIQSTGVGGGARIIFEHVNRLKDLGYDVELYNLEGNPKWFDLKVRVRTFKNYPQLIKALEKEEAIKVATWWETAEPVWLASIKKGIPVFFVQDIESSYYKDDEYMQNFVLSKYRKEFKYFTTSGVNEKALKEMGLSPTVIPCGMDIDIYKPLKVRREKNVMLSVGRSHYLKNLTMTMDAWRTLGDRQPTFWMFGIEPQVAEGIKNTKYYYKPSDEEVNKLYNKTTVFVQTSRHEGFCLPVLEAMAAGAPVICTDAHGNADFCVDEENCLMIEHDDVVNLKKQIKRLFSDTKLQEKLRREGYKTAYQYSWPVVMDKLEKFFGNITPKNKK